MRSDELLSLVGYDCLWNYEKNSCNSFILLVKYILVQK